MNQQAEENFAKGILLEKDAEFEKAKSHLCRAARKC